MALTLYYHPLASFCHKVLIALYERGVAFDKRIIDLGDPGDRAALQSVWPFARFPVLGDSRRGRDVAESSIIIEYVDHYAPGTHTLIPGDWEEALDVRLWDRVFDGYVQVPMQAIVLDRILGSKGDMGRERETLGTAYALIDRRMQGREWAAGGAFSMADCAAAPALFYANTVHAFPPECAALVAYYERLMARPSVARVMEEARPYLGMYPFAENVEARFR